ncbi:uncharacterized protein LOC110460368 [Mizuhopecten yessoensis]|nr:uncharacterized protein LOC110460368 [Mizuhopecten yessoensis]
MKVLDLSTAALRDYEMGNYDSAIQLYTSLMEDEPECSYHLVNRAKCYLQQANYTKVVEDIKTALDIDPKNVEGAITGGRASTKLGKYEDAYHFYKAGLDTDPKSVVITEDLKKLQQVILDDYDKMGGESDEQGYDAVNFCGQDSYPGDDVLLRKEYESLERKYDMEKDIPAPPPDSLRSEKAGRIAVEAHRAMMAGKFPEALQFFTLAVELEPANKVLRRLRAEVRFLNEDLVGAIQDLWLIPKGERTADSWKLGGKVLGQIGYPIAAEFWLRKAYTLSEKKDQEAAIIFQKVRTSRIYSPMTTDFPVTVDFSGYGRGIYAKRDIPEGEVIFEDSPAVFGRVMEKDVEEMIPACDYCSQSLLTARRYFGAKLDTFDTSVQELIERQWPDVTPVMCDKCNIVTFCTDTCKERAWEEYHQLICPARCAATKTLYEVADNYGYGYNEKGEKVNLWLASFSPIILARMWAQIVTEAKRLVKKDGCTQPTIEHWAKAKAPFRKFIAFGAGDVSSKMSTVLQLFRDIFSDCGDGVKYEITDGEFTGRYYQASCNLQSFSFPVTPYHQFINRLSKVDVQDMRVLALLKPLEAKTPTANFCGIFSLHACLNHSCINNVEVCDGYVNDRGGVIVRAKRDITKGEELYTTYIDTSMPRKLRRAWLYKSFNFWCHCPRCVHEGDDPYVCTTCHKKSTDGEAFRGCGNCKKAWYCTVECQRKSWNQGHKEVCQIKHSDTS